MMQFIKNTRYIPTNNKERKLMQFVTGLYGLLACCVLLIMITFKNMGGGVRSLNYCKTVNFIISSVLLPFEVLVECSPI